MGSPKDQDRIRERRPPLLPPSFYRRDCLEVAAELLGKTLWAGAVVLRITEVEAYRSQEDSASHSRMGPTARNAPMWGPGGHAYVYLCYGVHQMLNVVADVEGVGAAVLIRAAEPLAGHAEILARRGVVTLGPASLAGPGKVAQALGVDVGSSGVPLFRRGPLEVREGSRPRAILAGPRVGVDYARPEHRDAPWRLADGDSAWVSHRARLKLRSTL